MKKLNAMISYINSYNLKFFYHFKPKMAIILIFLIFFNAFPFVHPFYTPNPIGRPDWQNQKFLKCCKDHGLEQWQVDCRYPAVPFDQIVLQQVNYQKMIFIVNFKQIWVSHEWHKCFTDHQDNSVCCFQKEVKHWGILSIGQCFTGYTLFLPYFVRWNPRLQQTGP